MNPMNTAGSTSVRPNINPDVGIGLMSKYPTLLGKQKKASCTEFLCECTRGPMELKFASPLQKKIDVFYGVEESNCCCRCLCPRLHPYTMTITSGDGFTGGKVATLHRPVRCPMAPCKICCHQKIEVHDHDGTNIGRFTETCWFCLPNFAVKNVRNASEYNVHLPICCGCLGNPCSEALCCCRSPFYVYFPGAEQTHVGKLREDWNNSLGPELEGLSVLEADFPNPSEADTKIRFVAGLVLLNSLFFNKCC